MALAALISAYRDSADRGAPLRALLPLAGRPLIERQVRLAAAAGADPVIVLVERVPAGLAEAIDRLRRDRFHVQVARSADEAAGLVAPEDRLILVADGFVGDSAWFRRMAEGDPPTVLTIADAGHDERYERIDAGARWAGLAAVDGALLRETADELGDWDLESTLLRRAVQAGARELRTDSGYAIAEREAELSGVERRVLEGAEEEGRSWASVLLAPVERFAAFRLMTGAAGPSAIGAVAALLTGLGAFAFFRDIPWAGMILLLLATPLEGVAERLGRIRMQPGGAGGWWHALLPVLAGAALLALGFARAEPDGWGAVALAVATIAFLLALQLETEHRRIRGEAFLAERRGMAWLLVPFALLGQWTAGIAFLFAYAAASFFWAQREVHEPPPAPPQD